MSPTPEPDGRASPPAHLRFFRCRSISVNGSELGLMPAFIQEKDFADEYARPIRMSNKHLVSSKQLKSLASQVWDR